MAPKLKRPYDSATRSVSPPTVKRRATNAAIPTAVATTQNTSNIRIFTWNVNGIGPLLQKRISFTADAVFPLRCFLKRHKWPHLLCLQEVKIKRTDIVTQRRLEQAANAGKHSGEPTYIAHFSLPRDKYNATGFGGKVHGVSTLIREDFLSQVKCTELPEWDLEGRVLIHELNCGVVVVNGYWVNGTNNTYRDPVSGSNRGTRHDHKLRFHEYMLDEVLEYAKSGKQVMLVGDVNIARHRIDGHPNLRTSPDQHVQNRADFNDKFFTSENGMKGIDVFRHLHGEEKKYTYHPRGIGWGQSCDRVDLIIVDRQLCDLGAVVSTDICDNPEDRGHSDHVPLWIELDLSLLQGSDLHEVDSISQKNDHNKFEKKVG